MPASPSRASEKCPLRTPETRRCRGVSGWTRKPKRRTLGLERAQSHHDVVEGPHAEKLGDLHGLEALEDLLRGNLGHDLAQLRRTGGREAPVDLSGLPVHVFGLVLQAAAGDLDPKGLLQTEHHVEEVKGLRVKIREHAAGPSDLVGIELKRLAKAALNDVKDSGIDVVGELGQGRLLFAGATALSRLHAGVPSVGASRVCVIPRGWWRLITDGSLESILNLDNIWIDEDLAPSLVAALPAGSWVLDAVGRCAGAAFAVGAEVWTPGVQEGAPLALLATMGGVPCAAAHAQTLALWGWAGLSDSPWLLRLTQRLLMEALRPWAVWLRALADPPWETLDGHPLEAVAPRQSRVDLARRLAACGGARWTEGAAASARGVWLLRDLSSLDLQFCVQWAFTLARKPGTVCVADLRGPAPHGAAGIWRVGEDGAFPRLQWARSGDARWALVEAEGRTLREGPLARVDATPLPLSALDRPKDDVLPVICPIRDDAPGLHTRPPDAPYPSAFLSPEVVFSPRFSEISSWGMAPREDGRVVWEPALLLGLEVGEGDAVWRILGPLRPFAQVQVLRVALREGDFIAESAAQGYFSPIPPRPLESPRLAAAVARAGAVGDHARRTWGDLHSDWGAPESEWIARRKNWEELRNSRQHHARNPEEGPAGPCETPAPAPSEPEIAEELRDLPEAILRAHYAIVWLPLTRPV